MVELKIMKVVDNTLVGHNIELVDEVIILQDGYNGYEDVKVCWHPERKIIQLIHKNDLLFKEYGAWFENKTLEDGRRALLVVEDDGCQIFVVNTQSGIKIKKVEVKGNESN